MTRNPAYIACALLWLGATLTAQTRTVRDGVYSEAQALRGRDEYRRHCQACHLEDLSGGIDPNSERVPALRRDNFGLSRRTLDNLYTFIAESMPGDDPGGLTAQVYVDILSYLLQENGFPAGGVELSADVPAMRTIQIVRRP